MTFVVEVIFTDRTRDEQGRFVEYRTRVDVLARDEFDARLMAAQQVAAIRDHLDGMVTDAQIVL